jgi:hypothetical protein
MIRCDDCKRTLASSSRRAGCWLVELSIPRSTGCCGAIDVRVGSRFAVSTMTAVRPDHPQQADIVASSSRSGVGKVQQPGRSADRSSRNEKGPRKVGAGGALP